MLIKTKLFRYFSELLKTLPEDFAVFCIDYTKLPDNTYTHLKINSKLDQMGFYQTNNREWGNFFTNKPQIIPNFIYEFSRRFEKSQQTYSFLVLNKNDIIPDKQSYLIEYDKLNPFFAETLKESVHIDSNTTSNLFIQKIITENDFSLSSGFKISLKDTEKIFQKTNINRIVQLMVNSPKNSVYFDIGYYQNADNSFFHEMLSQLDNHFSTHTTNDDINNLATIFQKYSDTLRDTQCSKFVNYWFPKFSESQKEKLYDLYPSQETKFTTIDYTACVDETNGKLPVFAYYWQASDFTTHISKQSYSEIYDFRDIIMRIIFSCHQYVPTHIANMGSLEYMYCYSPANVKVPHLTMEEFKNTFNLVLDRFVSRPQDRAIFEQRNLKAIVEEINNIKDKKIILSEIEPTSLSKNL